MAGEEGRDQYLAYEGVFGGTAGEAWSEEKGGKEVGRQWGEEKEKSSPQSSLLPRVARNRPEVAHYKTEGGRLAANRGDKGNILGVTCVPWIVEVGIGEL